MDTNDLAGFANSLITKFKFMTVFMFSWVRNPFLTLLLSCHVWVTSKIQINFRYRRYSEVLMILSYKFWNFFIIHVFKDKKIHCWYSLLSYHVCVTSKSRLTSGSRGLRGTDDCVLWICVCDAFYWEHTCKKVERVQHYWCTYVFAELKARRKDFK